MYPGKMNKTKSTRRNVIFSFDYELYLGAKSGSTDNCVLKPVSELIRILGRYKVRAVFFIDTTWLIKLKEISSRSKKAETDFYNVVSQIRELVKAGHYLFPHLHPHWLNACYLEDVNQWRLTDYSKYHFHSLNMEEREFLFSSSVAILNEIIVPIQPDYRPTGYRAGGWSIEPFSDFEPFFRKYGIINDFSKIENCTPYPFSGNLMKDNRGEFAEFPISKVKLPIINEYLNRLLLKYLWIMNDRGTGDGKGAPEGKYQSNKLQGNNETNMQQGEMAAIELLTRAKLHAYLKYLKSNPYMQFIAHPKMLSRHNLNVFQLWMNSAFHRFDIETDFMKMLNVG